MERHRRRPMMQALSAFHLDQEKMGYQHELINQHYAFVLMYPYLWDQALN